MAYRTENFNPSELLTPDEVSFLQDLFSDAGGDSTNIALDSEIGGGSGDVSKVGTPVDNQVGVWTGDGTIEGTTGLTFDGNTFKVSSGTSGDAVLTIEADTDNNDENDNAWLHIKQDGGAVETFFGLAGDAGAVFGQSITGILANHTTIRTSTDKGLAISVPDTTGVREEVMRGLVDSTSNDMFLLANGTLLNTSFLPTMTGYVDSVNSRWSVGLQGLVSSTNDASSSSDYGLVDISVARTTSGTDPINGTLSAVVNRKVFRVRNLENNVIDVLADGKVGLGVATPATRLHIIDTSEQLRLGYDASNYSSFTTNSSGQLTITSGGTNQNIFLDPSGTGIIAVRSGVGIKDASNNGFYVVSNSGDEKLLLGLGGVTGGSAQSFGFTSSGPGGAPDTNISRGAAGQVNVGTGAQGSTAGKLVADSVEVTDDAYGVGWNGSVAVPTKNAVYDKIETLSGGGTNSESATIEDPSASEDISWFFTNQAITLTEIRAVLTGSSTPSVTWTIRHSTDRSATGNEVVTSGTTTTSTTSGSDVTAFNDATIPADSFVWIETTAQSGTVTSIHFTTYFTVD